MAATNSRIRQGKIAIGTQQVELFEGVRFSSGAMTLDEARDYIESHASDGVKCPACTQHVKVYRRTLNRGMARALITLWRNGAGHHPVHLSRTVSGVSHEAAQLAWWNLIEPDDTKGFWMVTDLGRRFTFNKVEISRCVYVFNSKMLGFDDTQRVSIRDILGEEYTRQMATVRQVMGVRISTEL